MTEKLKVPSSKSKIKEPTAVPKKEEARAIGRYLKISPTKVRDLMRLVRGKSVAEAETLFKFSLRRGGTLALKVLRSAEANAGVGFSKAGWVVAAARADKGPIFRRKVDIKARTSRGSISTPSTHVTIVIKRQAPDSDKRKEEKNGAQA